MSEHDAVNRPKHYTAHPSGVECIQITEHMGFNLGNAIKYIWRADLKADAIEDLKKAVWYLQRELAKRDAPATATPVAGVRSWHQWLGGACPVEGARRVDVIYKGSDAAHRDLPAGALRWEHQGTNRDIYWWRIATPLK